jgi:hypothetical protein
MLGVLSFAGPARAASSPPEAAQTPQVAPEGRTMAMPSLGVDLHLGFGTPTGLIGLMLDWSPSLYFALDAGGGLGAYGPQVALSGRLRLPIGERAAVGLGGGVSGGPSTAELCASCSPDPSRYWSFAVFGNTEVSFERRSRGGFQTRSYFGIAWVLNPDSATCSGGTADECAALPANVVYLGFSIGHGWLL